jgi:hypothetical protein
MRKDSGRSSHVGWWTAANISWMIQAELHRPAIKAAPTMPP